MSKTNDSNNQSKNDFTLRSEINTLNAEIKNTNLSEKAILISKSQNERKEDKKIE